jgi:hypothetical protein
MVDSGGGDIRSEGIDVVGCLLGLAGSWRWTAIVMLGGLVLAVLVCMILVMVLPDFDV